jgi:hypothetical protein
MNWFLAVLLALPASGLAAGADQGHEQHQAADQLEAHNEHQGHDGHQDHEEPQRNEGHQGHEEHQAAVKQKGQDEHQGHEGHQGHEEPQRNEGHQGHEEHQAAVEQKGQDEHQGHDGHQGHEEPQRQEEHHAHEGHQGHQDQAGTDEHQGHQGHEGHNMTVDATGVVMNENSDTLPRGCDEISRDHEFTIYAGHEYAGEPGMIFGMSEPEVNVEPCSRVNVTFINEDQVRHQWMVHGLPKYLYPAGMFHIEAAGGTSRSGTFIVPAESRNYLIHCDMAQHMEMGMRGQLVVGGGGGDLWGIPSVSDAFLRAPYWPRSGWILWAAASLILSASFFGVWYLTVIKPRRRDL